nr:MAG TPA: hypothetical protein [Caudoviricetes sp.]
MLVCVIIWVQAKNTSCWVLLGFSPGSHDSLWRKVV